ncbi:threonine/serine exporter family protein [uncultured Cetobacterium sp.]|uniref:threonine/serine exporter family protein n=1 Tax=uncultured Cetobacterium sp. TaxID=527638 RepID=UPI002619DAFB|nr:threonine/serine exporter family protein [uncultured Cetobacterium sp.]
MFFLEVLFAFFITASFAIIFNVRGKLIFYSGIGGAISWFFYLLFTEKGYSYSTCYLLATAITAFYSEVMAKKLKTTVPTLLIAALIPMAPGGGVYYTMLYLIENNYQESMLKGMETSIIAGSMALGIILITTCFRIFHHRSK